MIGVVIPALTGLGGVALATLYWRRQLRSVERGVATSAEWDRLVDEFETDGGDAEATALLNSAASKADVPPEGLPERIDERTEKLRDRRSRIESMREGWVATYWRALETEAAADTPRVVPVVLDGGTHDDARAFAIHALETDDEVVLAVGRTDGAFAVGISESLVESREVRADDIAAAIAAAAGGGAGGTATLATGGTGDTEALIETVEASAQRLQEGLESGTIEPTELA